MTLPGSELEAAAFGLGGPAWQAPQYFLDGKYQLVRELGAGGMGIVYEARHTTIKRRFAIKLLRPHLCASVDAIARFEREARLAACLESPHLAPALDVGTYNGVPFILMELLEGESLEARMDRLGRLPPAMAASLVAQACAGIRVAHDNGVVHRDMKPSNLFICRDSEKVKVLDFGIAKLVDGDESDGITTMGTLIGTAAYMSPEQARGEGTVGRAADIYALGTILYELLAGRRPFLGKQPHQLIRQVVFERPPPLQSVGEGLPPVLCSIVDAMLKQDPEQRPDAATLERELALFGKDELGSPLESGASTCPRSSSLRTGSSERFDALATTATTVDGADQRPALRSSGVRPRGLLVAAILAVAIPSLALGWLPSMWETGATRDQAATPKNGSVQLSGHQAIDPPSGPVRVQRSGGRTGPTPAFRSRPPVAEPSHAGLDSVSTEPETQGVALPPPSTRSVARTAPPGANAGAIPDALSVPRDQKSRRLRLTAVQRPRLRLPRYEAD